MFNIVRADKVKIDIREQMAEIFAEGYSQWLVCFSKDKSVIAKAFAHMFVLEQFYDTICVIYSSAPVRRQVTA